jgi:hypothetical protein
LGTLWEHNLALPPSLPDSSGRRSDPKDEDSSPRPLHPFGTWSEVGFHLGAEVAGVQFFSPRLPPLFGMSRPQDRVSAETSPRLPPRRPENSRRQ